MNNNQKEICPIEYMIANRRPKRKRSKAKQFKRIVHRCRSGVLKTSVSVACIVSVIGASVLTYSMMVKKDSKLSKQASESNLGLSQQDINNITRSLDVKLMGLIERYQNFDKMSPRMAVDNALYDMWKQIEIDYKDNPSEENKICLGHISKRGKQANRLLLSNVLGDENPFLERVYNETYKQDKVSTSNMPMPQQMHTR